jgi:hypothetical protein
MNKVLLWISVFVLCLAAVAAANETNTTNENVQYLEFSSIDIKVTDDINGKDDKADEGDSKFDIFPGSKVEFEIEVKNLYDKDIPGQDLEMQNGEVVITIFDIDDGDDLEEDADFDDIKPGKKESATLEFDIPLKVEDGNFDVLIEFEAEDENGTIHRINKTYTARVDKERHQLIWGRFELFPTTISCDETAELRFSVINIGREDEDDTVFRAVSDALNLNYFVEEDIDAGGESDDVEFKDTITISASGVKPGSYPIRLDVEYDDGDEVLSRTATLRVEACDSGVEDSSDDTSEQSSQQQASTQTTTQVQQPVQNAQPQQVVQPQPIIVEYNEVPTSSGVFASTPEKSWISENSTLVLVISALVALLLLAWIIKR